MNYLPDNLIRSRRKVEVLYVPDTLIDNIIDQAGVKSDGLNLRRHKKFIEESDEQFLTPLKTRLTRSGRKIANKLRGLSLNDNTPEKISNETEVDTPNKLERKPQGKLFESDDVDGKDMFSFRTPKRHNSMVSKANEVISKTIETPKCKKSMVKNDNCKTPYSMRNKIKKRLISEAAKQELDRLLEDSGSDYVPSNSSDSDSSDSDSAEDFRKEDSEEDSPTMSPPKKTRQQMKDYKFTSEDYFDRKYSKILTSSHTLKKLKTPKLAQNQLKLLLKSVPTVHKKPISYLNAGITKYFKHWLFCFSEGFNVLLYGLGSKRKILSTFHHRYLQDCYVLYISGYFPDNSIKKILEAIACDILRIQNLPSQPHDVIEAIKEKLKHKNTPRLFILISDLDAKPFQNEKTQKIFSELVKIDKIHMVATLDHINSALLWDQSRLSSFNFIWEDCTNFEPYFDETSYEGSLMVNWSGGLALASLKNVFNSLTVNSRKVFKILLQHYFENKAVKYNGMLFADLYRKCREGFIVSSDLALRTLLTEFTDHELVKWKKDTDHLVVTLDQHVLKQFKDEVDLDS